VDVDEVTRSSQPRDLEAPLPEGRPEQDRRRTGDLMSQLRGAGDGHASAARRCVASQFESLDDAAALGRLKYV